MVLAGSPAAAHLDAPCRSTIHSYTLLEDGKTICFSSAPGRKGGFGTYCFDTSGHVWTKGGDASALPFIGRALHVPELHNLFFGFLDSKPHTLCAAELPSADQDGVTAPPIAQGAAQVAWLLEPSLAELVADE